MNISIIFASGIVIALMVVIVGGLKNEYGMIISVCGGVLLLLASLPVLKN